MRNLAALLCLLACSDPRARVCVPGETVSCLIAGGAEGVQACNAEGSGLGPCQVCQPGELHACIHTDGRAGTQVCIADGSGYRACQ